MTCFWSLPRDAFDWLPYCSMLFHWWMAPFFHKQGPLETSVWSVLSEPIPCLYRYVWPLLVPRVYFFVFDLCSVGQVASPWSNRPWRRSSRRTLPSTCSASAFARACSFTGAPLFLYQHLFQHCSWYEFILFYFHFFCNSARPRGRREALVCLVTNISFRQAGVYVYRSSGRELIQFVAVHICRYWPCCFRCIFFHRTS